MATSAQTRLDRLFKNKPKPQILGDKGALTFWEKELINSQQQQQRKARIETVPYQSQGSSNEGDDYVVAHDTSRRKTLSNDDQSGKRKPSFAQSGEAVFLNNQPQPVYLHKGRSKGGPLTSKIISDFTTNGSDLEPASSSRELIDCFCLFSQVVKFPYKYMYDPGDQVSQRFFASEKIYERNWKMHYLFGTESYVSKPLMLVPFEQVQSLVTDIGNVFQIAIDVPSYPFQLSFYRDGTLTPKFAGQVNSKSDIMEIQSRLSNTLEDSEGLQASSVAIRKEDDAAWREKLDRVLEVEKKRKSTTRKGDQTRQEIPVEHTNALQRVQRYLGLKQRLPTEVLSQLVTSSRNSQIQDIQNAAICKEALDTSKPMPFSFEDNTIIICVDVEAWEMDHGLITEVGVSTLDTADIKNLAPGSHGQEWIKKIRSRHFRINGRECLKNYKFCQGHPDMFQYGKSEFISMEDASEIVDSCFEYPYSMEFEYEGPVQDGERCLTTVPTSEVLSARQQTSIDEGKARTLILVGHDVDGDIEYLSTLGSNIFGSSYTLPPDGAPSRRQRVLSSLRERLDTAVLHKTLKRDEQTRSLARVCHDLDITAWYPHNAGNDARYTLEAFIKIGIKAREQEDEAISYAFEIDTLDAKKPVSEIEEKQGVEARIHDVRSDIVSSLAASGEAAASIVRRRTQSPFFKPELGADSSREQAASNEDEEKKASAKVTYNEATRLYLKRYGIDESGDTGKT